MIPFKTHVLELLLPDMGELLDKRARKFQGL